MIKSDTADSSGRLSIGVTCGDCLHFKKGPAKFEDVCSELGVQSFAKAPNCFTPNIYKLSKVPDVVGQLGRLIKDLKPSQLRLLVFTIRNASALHRIDLKFGQPVFFTVGEEYISHYYKGYVISTYGGTVVLGSSLSERNSMTCLLPRDSLLTVSEWRDMRDILANAGRIKPLYSRFRMPDDTDDYYPPALNNAPKDTLASKPVGSKPGPVKRRGKKPSVSSVVTDSGSAVSIRLRKADRKGGSK